MPLIKNHRVFLELYDLGGKFRHRWETTDFRNCMADFRFSAFRQGLLPNDGSDPLITLKPLLTTPRGTNGNGFQLIVDLNGAPFTKIYGQYIFRYEIRRVLMDLMKAGESLKDVDLKFRLIFLKESQNKSVSEEKVKQKFSFTAQHPKLPIVNRKLSTFLGKTTLHLNGHGNNGDFPVYVAEHVVQTMIEHSLKNKEREEAGFLSGYLCQDPDGGELFSICTDQIVADGGAERPVDETGCSVVQFQFSPEIFYHAQQIVAHRNKGETLLGWWHSHPWPFTCQKTDRCKCTSLFFSAADVEVMEAAFAAPYQVAVVIGGAAEAPKKAVPQMYGWRDGLMAAREFERFLEIERDNVHKNE